VVPATGVPTSVSVVLSNHTPAGSVPDSVTNGAGAPLAATAKPSSVPVAKVVLVVLVNDGAVPVLPYS
jgi:hypothetical protein